MQLFARLVILAGSIGGILVVLAWFFVMQGDWDTAALLIKPGAYLLGGTAGRLSFRGGRGRFARS